MPRSERTILHLDMDAYFAEVERLSNPHLRGKPLVIGGRPGDRGVVSTASYEARAFGVRSGMPLTRAMELCPRAVFLPCDPAKYTFFTSQILKLLLRIIPCAEMWSIDEAFLDVSDRIPPGDDRFLMVEDHGSGKRSGGNREMPLARLARSIQSLIEKDFHLTCSIGGGPNKMVAKMATGLHKPRGLTLLDRKDFLRIFWPRPVEDLWGVGEKTASFLQRLGIRTIGDLARCDPRVLSRIMGVAGESLVSASRGYEDSPVVPYGEAPPPKSLGHEHTVDRDLENCEDALALLLALTDKVAREMRQEGYVGRTVVVKIRTSSFKTFTRQRSLRTPTSENRVIYGAARELFLEHAPGESLRLLGLTMGGLSRAPSTGPAYAEEPLFEEDRRYRRLLLACDRIHEEYGPGRLVPAAVLRERP